jgi:phosphoribosylformylglycinamidine synthase
MKAFLAVTQQLNREGKLLAYHDRSDGGLFVTLVEMAFAGRMGLEIDLPAAELGDLFSEELGAVVQVAAKDVAEVLARFSAAGLSAQMVGRGVPGNEIVIRGDGEIVTYRNTRTALQAMWAETSFHIQSLRDNPESARAGVLAAGRRQKPRTFGERAVRFGGARRRTIHAYSRGHVLRFCASRV